MGVDEGNDDVSFPIFISYGLQLSSLGGNWLPVYIRHYTICLLVQKSIRNG